MDADALPSSFDHLWQLTASVLEVNGLHPSGVEDVLAWVDVGLGDMHGAIAVVRCDTLCFAVVNVPMLRQDEVPAPLSAMDLLLLAPGVDWLATAHYAIDPRGLYLTACPLVDAGRECERAGDVLHQMLGAVSALRWQLERRLKGYSPSRPVGQPQRPVHLPNIKMTPEEFAVVAAVLRGVREHTQHIFCELMEQWQRLGYAVSTTSSTITLNIPFGERRLHLAHLLVPGSAKEDVIILNWGGLKDLRGFTPGVLENYRKSIQRLGSLRFTPASAYLPVSERFTLQHARRLVKAMHQLACAVAHDQVQPLSPFRLTTPENSAQTLEACPPHARAVFNLLIAGWKQAGGIVQCPRPGRIYLKLKTAPHRSGHFARLPHRFNLLVLCAPRRKAAARIEVAWELGSLDKNSFLDCIPQAVEQFERQVAALPGFCLHGHVARLEVDETFTFEAAKTLLEAAVQLKEAEQEAP